LKKIDTKNRWRDRLITGMSWLWFSCLALLALLPPVNLAEAHLWKSRPFRANDTDHSGGDHICDLRRDSNADGKPDRLDDYVSVSGTVIVEPSTYETGGWLFWIRHRGCGILVYGEPENLSLGDSVAVSGWVRISNGNYSFPETGLATLGDVTLESRRVWRIGGGGCPDPEIVPVVDLAACPARWGGNLIALGRSVRVTRVAPSGPDEVAWARCGTDSIVVYIDGDTGCRIAGGRCYHLAGVVARMMMPPGSATSQVWCLVPRCPGDIAEAACSTDLKPTAWGHLKSRYDSGLED
jgi:hypothetical protein